MLKRRLAIQKGFTLIEVLVSFAVLAIVGGALMQTFVVSTKINRRAYDTDKASALVVHVQDSFKGTSAGGWNPIGEIPEFAHATVTSSAGVVATVAAITTWTAQLNSDWLATATPADAWYACTAELTEGVPLSENGAYYPEADVAFDLPDTLFVAPMTLTLQMRESGGQYVVSLNGSGLSATTAIASDVIVHIHNNGVPFAQNLILNMTNQTVGTPSPKMDVYVFDQAAGNTLTVSPDQGLSSYTAVDRSQGESIHRYLRSTLTRLSDGTVLGDANGESYQVLTTTP